MPQNLPAPAVDLEDDRLWFEAVAYLKAPSARGADAISTSELEQLPKLAITHVKYNCELSTRISLLVHVGIDGTNPQDPNDAHPC